MRLLVCVLLLASCARVHDERRVISAYAFRDAAELMKKEEFEAAALKFTELVAANPEFAFADLALNNAAVCRETQGRFELAGPLYERLLSEYPDSTIADAVLFRVARNAEMTYDFERAIVLYQRLVKNHPTSRDRENASANAARILEALHRYSEAAAANEQYADLFPGSPGSPDAPRSQLRAAVIYGKMGAGPKELAALNRFLLKYSAVASEVELAHARARIAELKK